MAKVRLGQGGSLMNRLHEAAPQPDPEVGMGATIPMYTDRQAATIIEVGKSRVVIQEDKARRADNNGMSESQSYEYTPNPSARHRTFTKRKNGMWIEEGQSMRNGQALIIGYRDAYRDYSF